MKAPEITDCAGLWRRSLLIDADGRHDTSAGVQWLQGITAYVDSRGFAGRLQQSSDVFEWHRDVDLEAPGPFPDAGAMRWEGDTLVEIGVHAVYAEHWVRDEMPAGPIGAAFLRAPGGGEGLLMRVGDSFGWAGGCTVALGPVGGPQWDALSIESSDDHVEVGGVRWSIERSEGTLNS